MLRLISLVRVWDSCPRPLGQPGFVLLGDVLVEKQIRALKAEGFSVREIARELGLSRMKAAGVSLG